MIRLDLDSLAAASREALMSEWREVVGQPPPKHLSKPLMVQILSHTYQLETLGGYTKRLDQILKSAAQRPLCCLNSFDEGIVWAAYLSDFVQDG